MTIDRREPGNGSEAPTERRTWQPMALTYIGDIKELVKGGSGKSAAGADPGDQLKPSGQDN